MKAFISYSLNDQEMYLLTLLSSKLKERGFTILQSTDFYGEMSSKTKVDIDKSDLFIGIITENSDEQNRVMSEWRLAGVTNKPLILLVENGVNVSKDFNYYYIRFDRYNPKNAVNELNKKITCSRKRGNDSDSWLWVVGGAAVIGLLALLSSSNKK
jgi:hypothetical protein